VAGPKPSPDEAGPIVFRHTVDRNHMAIVPETRQSGNQRRSSIRALLLILTVVACLAGLVYGRPFWVMDHATKASLRLEGVRGDYVRLGAYRIHFLAGGEGKPMVLVHGLGGRAQDWAMLMPYLMRRGYRIYALDLLGFGESQRPDVDYSISLQTDILNQFIESQGLMRVDLAGWSMGGWVALKFTLAHPERVRRLAVFDSAGLDFKPAWDPGLFHPSNADQAQEFFAWLTPQASRIPRFVARDFIREARAHAWVVDRARQSMDSRTDALDGKLNAIQVPVLIVWGKQDILIPLSCGEQMHREMPQSSLEVFDGCGHLAPVECSSRVGPEVVEFLDADPPLPASVREFPR
jgi:pimeloyl-ACP methyl ester carboxylesterase